MVNTVALKYFKDNYQKYPLEDLKKEALSKGCSQADIDEVLMMLGISGENKSFNDKALKVPVSEVLNGGFKKNIQDAVKEVVPIKSIVEKISVKRPEEDLEIKDEIIEDGGEEKFKEEISVKIPSKPLPVISGGFEIKWMKLSGILGIVFLILFAGLYVLSFFGFSFSEMPSWISIVFLTLIVVVIYFWFFGFLKIGKASGVRTLEVACVLNVIVVLIIVALLILFVSGGLSFVFEGSSLPTFSDMVKGGVGPLSFLVIILSLFFIVRLVFSIGLIMAEDSVLLAKVSGIFGIVAVVLIGAVLGVMGYFILNPVSGFLSTDSPVYSISMVSLSLILLLLESLVLFNGSRHFED